MKIEKITENKIRIIIKKEDLKDSSIDLHTIMTKAVESQGLFLEILDKAKKECGFDTDGHKLLIEAFSSQDEDMVFTITKFELKDDAFSIPSRSSYPRRLAVRRKTLPNSDFSIYRFDDFEHLCSFCESLKIHSQFSTRGLVHSSSLYSLKGNFFLVLNGVHLNHKSLTLFNTVLSEFATFCTHTNDFEHRLKEYGNCIMKKNAISTALKFFG